MKKNNKVSSKSPITSGFHVGRVNKVPINQKLTSRQRAQNAVDRWSSQHKGAISASEVAQIMLSNYDFAEFTSSGKLSAPLMFYDDDKSSSNYGLYVENNDKLADEVSLVAPKMNVATNLRNIIIYIRARCKKISDDLPKQKYLVAVNNGLYDVKHHKLIPFSPSYIFTTKVHTDYKKNIKCPVINGWSFDKFLEDAVGKAQLKLTWQMINNAVNGNIPSNRVFIFKGNSYGRNGKSTLEDAIGYVISGGQSLNLCSSVSTTKMTDFGGQFGLSTLPNTLLDIGDNVDSHARVNQRACANLHSLITGDPVDVNIKNVTPFSLMYHGLLIQSSNGYPKYADNNGMERRTEVITFTHTFAGGNDNIKTDYIRRASVREYILKKALSFGVVRKYDESSKTKQANNSLMNNSDKVRQFTTKVFPKLLLTKIPCTDLFQIYLAWCKDNHSYTNMTKQTFNSRFKDAIDETKYRFTRKICKTSNKMHEYMKNAVDNVDFYINKYDLIGLSDSNRSVQCWVMKP